jgi:hypothetical protein
MRVVAKDLTDVGDVVQWTNGREREKNCGCQLLVMGGRCPLFL